MKILYIPLDTAIPEEDDFYIALKKAGNEVLWYWDRLYGSWHGIDVIHLQSGAVNRETVNCLIRERDQSVIVTQWTGDYRPEPLEMVTQYEGLVDITYMAAYVPELYPKENIKWLPHGVADWNFREINPDAEGIVMIANNYPQFPGGKEREEMHKLLSQRKDYVCYGSGFEGSLGNIPYRETPDIYNKFRFAVGCNIYNDVDRYFSNRPLIAMAAGCCFMYRKIPNHSLAFILEYEDNAALYDYLNISFSARDKYSMMVATERAQEYLKDNYHYDYIVKMWENEL